MHYEKYVLIAILALAKRMEGGMESSYGNVSIVADSFDKNVQFGRKVYGNIMSMENRPIHRLERSSVGVHDGYSSNWKTCLLSKKN